MPRPAQTLAFGRLDTGEAWDAEPILLADRLAMERAARANQWTPQGYAITIGAFLSWHASKRAGHHTLTFEEFLAHAADADVYIVDTPTPAPATPTTATAGTA